MKKIISTIIAITFMLDGVQPGEACLPAGRGEALRPVSEGVSSGGSCSIRSSLSGKYVFTNDAKISLKDIEEGRLVFAFIKPEVKDEAERDKIIREIKAKGFEFIYLAPKMLRTETARAHYREHLEPVKKAFAEGIVSYITEGEIIAMVLRGPKDAAGVFRQFVGKNDGSEPGTIRYNRVTLVPDANGATIQKNAIHASDSFDSALRETLLVHLTKEEAESIFEKEALSAALARLRQFVSGHKSFAGEENIIAEKFAETADRSSSSGEADVSVSPGENFLRVDGKRIQVPVDALITMAMFHDKWKSEDGVSIPEYVELHNIACAKGKETNEFFISPLINSPRKTVLYRFDNLIRLGFIGTKKKKRQGTKLLGYFLTPEAMSFLVKLRDNNYKIDGLWPEFIELVKKNSKAKPAKSAEPYLRTDGTPIAREFVNALIKLVDFAGKNNGNWFNAHDIPDMELRTALDRCAFLVEIGVLEPEKERVMGRIRYIYRFTRKGPEIFDSFIKAYNDAAHKVKKVPRPEGPIHISKKERFVRTRYSADFIQTLKSAWEVIKEGQDYFKENDGWFIALDFVKVNNRDPRRKQYPENENKKNFINWFRALAQLGLLEADEAGHAFKYRAIVSPEEGDAILGKLKSSIEKAPKISAQTDKESKPERTPEKKKPVVKKKVIRQGTEKTARPQIPAPEQKVPAPVPAPVSVPAPAPKPAPTAPDINMKLLSESVQYASLYSKQAKTPVMVAVAGYCSLAIRSCFKGDGVILVDDRDEARLAEIVRQRAGTASRVKLIALAPRKTTDSAGLEQLNGNIDLFLTRTENDKLPSDEILLAKSLYAAIKSGLGITEDRPADKRPAQEPLQNANRQAGAVSVKAPRDVATISGKGSDTVGIPRQMIIADISSRRKDAFTYIYSFDGKELIKSLRYNEFIIALEGQHIAPRLNEAGQIVWVKVPNPGRIHKPRSASEGENSAGAPDKEEFLKDYMYDDQLCREGKIAVIVKSQLQKERNQRQALRFKEGAGVTGREVQRAAEHGLILISGLDRDQIPIASSDERMYVDEPTGFDIHGTKLAYSNWDRVIVYDFVSGETKVIKNDWFAHLHTVVFSEDGKRILVASPGFDMVLEVSAESGEVIWEWCGWERGYNRSRNKEYIYSRDPDSREIADAKAADPDLKIVIADKPKDFGGYGTVMRHRASHINTAVYDKDGNILATLFFPGQIIMIDRKTKECKAVYSGLVKPHGATADDRQGYYVTGSDGETAHFALLDRNFGLIKKIRLAGLPAWREGFPEKMEWFQYTTHIKDNIYAMVDIHRKSIYLVDTEKKSYRAIGIPEEWCVQMVVATPDSLHLPPAKILDKLGLTTVSDTPEILVTGKNCTYETFLELMKKYGSYEQVMKYISFAEEEAEQLRHIFVLFDTISKATKDKFSLIKIESLVQGNRLALRKLAEALNMMTDFMFIQDLGATFDLLLGASDQKIFFNALDLERKAAIIGFVQGTVFARKFIQKEQEKARRVESAIASAA